MFPVLFRFALLPATVALLACASATIASNGTESQAEALYASGDDMAVLDLVENAPAGGVTSAQLSLLKGLSAQRLGMVRESLVALIVAEALGSRDPRLRPALTRARSRSLGSTTTSRRFRSLEEARAFTDMATSGSGAGKKIVEEPIEMALSNPLSIELSVAGGWNSNVLGLGKGFPNPAGSTRPDGGFLQLGVNLAYQWRINPSFYLNSGWIFQQSFYEGHSAANLMYNYWFTEGVYRITNLVSSYVRLSDEYTAYGGYSFRNTLAVNPGIFLTWSPRNVTEISYTYSYSDYFFQDAFPYFERTGNEHTLRVRQILYSRDMDNFISVGYHHTWNLAQGADFAFQENGIGAYFGVSLPWQFQLNGYYTWAIAQYQNPNSLAGSNGFAYRRRDLIQGVGAELSRPIFWKVQGFAAYNYTNNYSNIGFYNYDQHIITAGVRLRF